MVKLLSGPCNGRNPGLIKQQQKDVRFEIDLDLIFTKKLHDFSKFEAD